RSNVSGDTIVPRWSCRRHHRSSSGRLSHPCGLRQLPQVALAIDIAEQSGETAQRSSERPRNLVLRQPPPDVQHVRPSSSTAWRITSGGRLKYAAQRLRLAASSFTSWPGALDFGFDIMLV